MDLRKQLGLKYETAIHTASNELLVSLSTLTGQGPPVEELYLKSSKGLTARTA